MSREANEHSDVIFVVHGSNAHTWWRRLANGGYAWWRPWSLFSYSLRKTFSEDCSIRDYRWSGINSNQARMDAGVGLAAAIREEAQGRKVHIIGHSHGGNVALVAANHLPSGTISTVFLLANPHLAVLQSDGSPAWLYWSKATERVERIWNLYSPADPVQSTVARAFHGIPSIARSSVRVSRTYDGPDSQKILNVAITWRNALASHRAMHSSSIGTMIGKLMGGSLVNDAKSAAGLHDGAPNDVPDRGGFAGLAQAQQMIRDRGDSRPFDLAPMNHDIGLLLVHGFTASPSELRPMADCISQRVGWRCKALLLPGHGTRVEDLQKTQASDWLSAVDKAYEELASQCRSVFLAGLSLGAVLCCHAGLRRREDSKLRGLILLAPSFGVSVKRTLGIRLLAPLKYRRSKGPRAIDYFLENRLFTYVETPIDRAADVLSLGRKALRNLDKLRNVPMLMLSGELDRTVSLDLIRTAAKQNPWIRFVSLPKSRHILTVEPDSGAVFEECLKFMQAHVR